MPLALDSDGLAPSTATRGGRAMPLALMSAWLLITMGWWWLAFAPVDAASADLLARTRQVCFGTLDNGLPDTYGWMLLILAPISLVIAMITVYHDELKASLGELVASRAGKVVLGLVLAGVLSEALIVTGTIRTALSAGELAVVPIGAQRDLPEAYPRTQKPAPEIALVDQNGVSTELESMRGKTVLLTFAFAHCQTVCPLLVSNTLSAFERLDPEETRVLVITLDPWRDTPSALPTLAEQWGLPPGARVASGEVDAVLGVLGDYEVPWQRDPKTGDVAHPALIYVLDPVGRIAYTFNDPPVDWLVTAARRAGETVG